jgi:hypothetical protein
VVAMKADAKDLLRQEFLEDHRMGRQERVFKNVYRRSLQEEVPNNSSEILRKKSQTKKIIHLKTIFYEYQPVFYWVTMIVIVRLAT